MFLAFSRSDAAANHDAAERFALFAPSLLALHARSGPVFPPAAPNPLRVTRDAVAGWPALGVPDDEAT
jgi:hypothetical protein